jgi:hypothetical protein
MHKCEHFFIFVYLFFYELTVQLMLSYGAQGNCPTTHLPHPTCYEAQGLGPTPSLASSHHVIIQSLMELDGIGSSLHGLTKPILR